jgi:hypothetical protein
MRSRHFVIMLRSLLFLFLTLSLTAEEKVSLGRIVVIGASVSRGFTEAEPFGGEKSNLLRLDRFLDAALQAPHGKIINDSNHLFFTTPKKEADQQLDRLSRRNPSLVVGVDFLFWFLYGYPEKTGDRLVLFEQGLELLSSIEAPLIVGDIPDASASIGRMLARSMVPDARTRAEANRRLAAWAAERPDVTIVSLSRFLKSAEANAAIELGQLTFEEGTTRDLLQPDRLHPTPTGCAALALAVLSSLSDEGLKQNEILWDPDQVARLATSPPE